MYVHYFNKNNINRIKFTIYKIIIKNEKKKKERKTRKSLVQIVSQSPHNQLGSIAHVTISHIAEVLIAIQYITLQ